MCFAIHPYHLHALTAEEDIPCFKQYRLINRENGLLASLFYNHMVQVGETYILDSSLEVISGQINEGFHSFDMALYVNEGMLHNAKTQALVRCIIPKGTIYYQNPATHEYVSESIKVLSIMDLSKYKDPKFKDSFEKVSIDSL